MRPILKKDFITTVQNLLDNGFRPEFYTVDNDAQGIIAFTDKNGDRQVERVYCQHTPSRDLIAKRFRGWFEAVNNAYHAKLTDALTVGDKVQDGDTVRTVTTIRRVVKRSANGTPMSQECAATGVIVLDNQFEVMAGDVKPVPAEGMTPTAAIKHMYFTLAGLLEQSAAPDFDIDAGYADVRTNFELVEKTCHDLATTVWLSHRLRFWPTGDGCTFAEENQEIHDRLAYILRTGWLPGSEAGAEIQLSTLFEMEWNPADDIAITSTNGYKTQGCATVTDEEGLYMLAFEWMIDVSDSAQVMAYITAARFVLPDGLKLKDCDALAAVQEMDSIFGLTVDIANEVTGVYDQVI